MLIELEQPVSIQNDTERIQKTKIFTIVPFCCNEIGSKIIAEVSNCQEGMWYAFEQFCIRGNVGLSVKSLVEY